MFHPSNSNPDWDSQSERLVSNTTIAGEQLSRLQTPPRWSWQLLLSQSVIQILGCHIVPAPSIWTLPQQSCGFLSLAWGLVKRKVLWVLLRVFGSMEASVTNNKLGQKQGYPDQAHVHFPAITRLCCCYVRDCGEDLQLATLSMSESILITANVPCLPAPYIVHSFRYLIFHWYFFFYLIRSVQRGRLTSLFSFYMCHVPMSKAHWRLSSMILVSLVCATWGFATTLEMSCQFYVCLCL